MYKCSRCGKTLYSRSHLELHESRCRGFGVRCPICGGIRKSLPSLRLHVRKGHDDLWKKCPICSRELKCSIVHYRRIKDDKHRELWILTARKSEGSIRRMAEEYLEMVKAGKGGLNGMG